MLRTLTDARESHRRARVDHRRAVEVDLVLVESHVGPAGAGQDLPVEASEVLAGDIFAEVLEFAPAAQLAARMLARGVAADGEQLVASLKIREHADGGFQRAGVSYLPKAEPGSAA